MHKSEYLFVYGTLMSVFNNPVAIFLRENALLKGKAHFNGLLFDLGNYPAAVYAPKTINKVFGEIYELKDPSKVFATLDVYEGLNDPDFNLYERKNIDAYIKEEVYKCTCYVLKDKSNTYKLIQSGDYIKYKNSN